MQEMIDMATRCMKGLVRGQVQRWRLLVLLPLILAAVACGGGGDGGGSEPGQATATPQPTGTALPDDLVGKWTTILTYVPAYYTGIVNTNDFIGSLGITLVLQSNGNYQFELSTASNYFNGNCFRTTDWNESGRVSITQTDITFTSTHATNMVMDSCGKAQYVDPAPTGTATYTMTREQDQTGRPILRLRMATGDDLVLAR